jgi:type IV secretion system protein VirB5
MRKTLALLTIIAAGLVVVPRAQAQVPVIDASNLAQNVQELAQDVVAVAQLKAELQQLENTYQMFTSIPNLSSIAPGLQSSSIENPMPAANALTSLLGGTTTPSGTASTYYQQNHIYTPADTSEATTLSTNNANGIANLEGMASTNLSAIQSRLQQLPDLESALNSATSITQVDAINGRIMAESQFVQGQQAQASNLQVLATEQQASQIQQGEELEAQEEATAPSSLAAADGNQ